MQASAGRILGYAIDTLAISVWGRITDELNEWIGEVAKLHAKGGRLKEVNVGGVVYRVGLSPMAGFSVMLRSNRARLLVARVRERAAERSTVLVILESQALREEGAAAAWAEVRTSVAKLLDHIEREAVTRVDICCDVVGWSPSRSIGAWITRAKNRHPFVDLDEPDLYKGDDDDDDDAPAPPPPPMPHDEEVRLWRDVRSVIEDWEELLQPASEQAAEHAQQHYVGRTWTGWTFGGGGLLARIYNKTVECLRRPKKAYVLDHYRQKGEVAPGQAVWRIEFQIRSDVLAELVGERPSVEKVINGAAGLWAHCSQEWLREVRVRTSKREKRRRVSKTWELISQSWGSAALERIPRQPQQTLRQSLIVQGLGAIARAAATHNELMDRLREDRAAGRTVGEPIPEEFAIPVETVADLVAWLSRLAPHAISDAWVKERARPLPARGK